MLQFWLNGLIAGSLLALTAVSFAVAYRNSGFFNFAHAGLIAAGAYSMLFLKEMSGLGTGFAVASFWLIPMAGGGVLERLVHQRLRLRRATATGLLLGSLASYTVIQSALALFFGDDTRSFRWWSIEAGWRIGNLRLTPAQAVIAIVSWALILTTWGFLQISNTGRRIRAVAASPELAQVVGIDIARSRLAAALLASSLAGISGFLIACDVDMSPTMGIQPFMTAVVAVLLAQGHMVFSGLVALALGVTQNIVLYWMPSGWQDVLIFSLLLGFLFFRRRRVEV